VESGTRVRKEWAKIVKSGAAKKNFPRVSIVNSAPKALGSAALFSRLMLRHFCRRIPRVQHPSPRSPPGRISFLEPARQYVRIRSPSVRPS
jgi:hypothetical protein